MHVPAVVYEIWPVELFTRQTVFPRLITTYRGETPLDDEADSGVKDVSEFVTVCVVAAPYQEIVAVVHPEGIAPKVPHVVIGIFAFIRKYAK